MVIRRYLVVWWMFVTALAVGLASFVVQMIPGRQGIVEGLVVGLIVGGAQWVLLRAADEYLNAWPFVTAAGWALVGLVTPDWPVWAGPWIAMLQWLVIRHYTRDAGWWIIASAVGWFLMWWLAELSRVFVTRGLRASAATAFLGTNASSNVPFYLVAALNWTIGALVYGMFTAVALAFVLEPGERPPTTDH